MDMLRNVGELQGLSGAGTGILEPAGFQGSALGRIGSGPAGLGGPNGGVDPRALELSGLNGALGALLGNFSQMFWDQRIASQSREVLQMKESGEAGQRDRKLQALSTDYESAKSRQVPLTQETERLAQQALGREAQQAPQSESGSGNGGGNSGSSESSPVAATGGGNNGARSTTGNSSSGTVSPGTAGQPGSANGTAAPSSDTSLLDRALSRDQNYDQLFREFGQTEEGNCAAIAVIKAAMDTYGNGLFENVQRNENGGYRVTMQDGYTTTVSQEELAIASQEARLSGADSEAKSYATLAYAAMGKRAQGEGNDGAGSYREGLQSLANGENPWDAARYLGLENRAREVDVSNIGGRSGVVAWNRDHAVYVDSSRTDYYGEGRNYNGTDGKGRELTSAIEFAPRERTSLASNGNSRGGGSEAPASPRSSRGGTDAPKTKTVPKATSTPKTTTATSSKTKKA